MSKSVSYTKNKIDMIGFLLFMLMTLLIVSPRIFPHSHYLRFYAVYSSYVTLVMILSLVPIALFPVFVRMKSVTQAYIATFTKLFFWLIQVQVEIKNGFKLKGEQQMIIICNHQSIFDFAVVGSAAQKIKDSYSIGRKEIRYLGPYGLAAWIDGMIFIDRDDPKTAMRHLVVETKRKFDANQNAKITIFPEGTRNQNGGGLLPFRRGAFRLAEHFQVPILPVVISPYYFIDKKKSFKPGKIILSVLKPINIKQGENLDEVIEKTRNLMEEEYFSLQGFVQNRENSTQIQS